jgi:hypothetical protein
MKAYLSQALIFLIIFVSYSKCDSACSIQNDYIEDNYNRGRLWARKFRDSWGKFPSGIFSGNYFDFGHFDQCIDFHHFSDDVSEIKGQYCVLMFPYQHRMRGDVSVIPYFAVDPHS